MLYLENVLESMKNSTDVIVRLSSHSTNKFTEAVWQDGCGNHHVENWLAAINNYSLQKVFMVASVAVETSPYSDKPQWTVTLVNEKSSITEILDRASNEAACKRCYEDNCMTLEKIY